MHVLKDKIFCWLQYLLPQHLLSRLLSRLADTQLPWLKNRLIIFFVRHYQVDLNEAQYSEPDHYPSFNDFFTRALKPGVRPVDLGPLTVVAAADGYLSQCGSITQGELLQAKGHLYNAAELIGDPHLATHFGEGKFITTYLSPADYHRVHMPLAGNLTQSRYIPGKLFSVNNATTKYVPTLFTRNERLVCVFESEYGPFIMVLVGAMLVAGIESVWHGHYAPATFHKTDHSGEALSFEKGEEMGRFKFGSTVILLLPNHALIEQLPGSGANLRMGEVIASFTDK